MLEDVLMPIRIGVVMAGLFYASYKDWVSREVDDWVWVICGVAGAVLTGLDMASWWSLDRLIQILISIVLSVGLAFAFYFFGFYGGADAKAIAVISVALPVHSPPFKIHPFTGLASLSNGLLFSLFILPLFLTWNLIALARGERIFEGFEHERGIRKLAAMLFGIRSRNARRRRFWFPLETERDGRRYFSFNILGLELEEIQRDDCWITPGLPLLISITAGFIFYILVGDVLALILQVML
ncbi:MAG: prepilin peptidase [Thaumarchaeota archaeon]|nr:prepilin peptidase [Candidatus Wolframiiraptor allenii]